MSEIKSCQKCVLGNFDYNIRYGKATEIGTKFENIFVLQNPKMNKSDMTDVKILQDICNEVGIKEEDYGILFLVKCSNIDNSPPSAEIIHQCANEHLIKELEKFKPKIIIAVGKVVSDYFGVRLGGSGRWNKSRVFGVYSPTALKYNQELKSRILEQFKYVKNEIYNNNKITKWSE